VKIQVSDTLCCGHGRCYSLVPELFSSDDDGYCAERHVVLDVPAGADHLAAAGVEACPEGAITIVPDVEETPT
jgi:ferredoxin